MSGQLPYLVEYAKTGRSKCKGCKNTVDKDHLRIAKVVRSPFHDGVVPNWFHRDCFFGRCRPASITEIENFDNIRWEDQESLKKEIENPEPSSSSSSRKRPAGLAPEYTIGYALSNRSKCVACDTPIIKGHIRVSKLDTESKNGAKYQGVQRFHHVDCFIKIRETLGHFASIDTCSGFDKLTEDDQKKVSSQIPAIDQPDGPPSPKKAKPSSLNPEDEQKLKEQNEKLFKYREELEKIKDGSYVFSELLEHNNQLVPKGKSEVLNTLTDQMVFGALSPCKKCSGKFLFISGVGYKCQGDLTEWTKCEEMTLNPERTEFKVPEDLKSQLLFLKEYKSEVSRRILRISEPPVMKTLKKPEETMKVDRGPMPLKGMDFVIAGRTQKSKDTLKKEIMELGGMVVGKVHENLAAVIADEKTLKRGSNVISAAKKHEIQVITEDFVDEAKDYEDTPIALINKKNIASWGADPKTRIDVSIMKSCGGSSGFEKKSAGKVKMVFADGCAVDPDSGMVDTTYVFGNEHGKMSATLVKTDIQSKKNSFYKIQVLRNKFDRTYWLFRSWGRIGTTAGGHKCDRYLNEWSVTNEFCAIFAQKTGNGWTDRKNFVKKPGLMCPIDDQDEPQQEEKGLEESESGVSCSLKKPVQDLVKLIFNVDIMKQTLKEFELDTEKMPLGKLSKRQLEKAYGVLKEVQELLANGQPDRALLIDASNRFYTLVPHSFGLDEPTVLDNEELIQSKCQMVDSLIEMEIAYSLLSVKQDDSKNPFDACYEQLKADIDVLDRESEEFKMIEEYARNTHAHTHRSYELEIENVFVVKRQGEFERYKPFKKLHNRKLLWHGSRTTNYAGILSQGLRIAPPEAPVTGYMFGKGVYFADMVSKSANYCCTSKHYPTGLLLLCEVALGDMYEKYNGEFIKKLPEGKHSTLGLGSTRPDPKKVLVTKDGVVVPYGTGVPSKLGQYCSLLYNEYIVYDVAQINVKYLIQMKFKYKY